MRQGTAVRAGEPAAQSGRPGRRLALPRLPARAAMPGEAQQPPQQGQAWVATAAKQQQRLRGQLLSNARHLAGTHMCNVPGSTSWLLGRGARCTRVGRWLRMRCAEEMQRPGAFVVVTVLHSAER